METFVPEDSPLADYLEGSGEGDADWAPQETDHVSPPSSPHSSPVDFAPKGRPKLQDRIRNKLPAPLRLKHSSKGEALARIQDACTVAISARIGSKDNERFLEQFGYIIVASQLLNEPAGGSTTIAGLPPNNTQPEDLSSSRAPIFGIQGAVFCAVASFSVVFLVHLGRPRQSAGWSVRRLFVVVILLAAVAVGFYTFARRQWLRYMRHEALDVASVLVGNAQNLDSVTAASVLLIQEVELVSRGYRLSTPMPPVSRLEEQSQTRRCLKLRHILSECMTEMLGRYLDAKNKLKLYVNQSNLVKYYDIYDFSGEELREPESKPDTTFEDRTSLRSLRTLFTKVFAARKGTLCCLLALPADGSYSDIEKWNVATEEMKKLATWSGACIEKLTAILNEQDRDIPPSPKAKLTPTRERHRAQLRRLNTLSQGIRGLQAKMHLIREESDGSSESSNEPSDLSSSLITQYESIGADLKGLLQEWEAGKTALLSNLERSDRTSCPPSILKSPSSPTFSLGGATAVDGSPAAALRALNGDESSISSPDKDMNDDEVFEAIALPRKRISMTREERIARMKEDRAKQASIREKSDANTHMLRELETVIKLRPRGKGGSRITSI